MYCGEWVVNSHKKTEDKLFKATDDLEQLVFSFAKENGLEEWITFDDSTKNIFQTLKWKMKSTFILTSMIKSYEFNKLAEPKCRVGTE